jgi:hypothetical protein
VAGRRAADVARELGKEYVPGCAINLDIGATDGNSKRIEKKLSLSIAEQQYRGTND